MFYEKYRPQALEDFGLTPDAVQVLRSLLELDHLSLLFVGNPGVGKSTLLQVLLREYSALHGLSLLSRQDFMRENVMFLSTLQEQGIPFYKTELRNFCQILSSHLSPRTGRPLKKIVCLDDLDVIPKQNQQIFRNYMDQFGHQMQVISVCTNLQKVIEGMQSRMHLFRLSACSAAQCERMLDRIVAETGLALAAEARMHVLRASRSGGIRMVVNHAEKLRLCAEGAGAGGSAPVSLELCKSACVLSFEDKFDAYLAALGVGARPGGESDRRSSDTPGVAAAVAIMYEMYDCGYSVIDILDAFFQYVKDTPKLEEEQKYRLIALQSKYMRIYHTLHEDCVELAFMTDECRGILGGNEV